MSIMARDTSETGSKLAIVMTNEIRGGLSILSRLPQLLGNPSIGRRSRHTDVDDLSRFQFNDLTGKFPRFFERIS